MNYGTVKFHERAWLVFCEPHVRTKLKRVFPRAPQEARDYIRISANPENTRDLRWFLDRYPMTVEDPQGALYRLSKQHVEMETRLADLLAGKVEPISAELAIPARDYQLVPAQMLNIRKALLLADDVGLGKTVSAIVGMVQEGRRPVLVTTLTHLPRQWKKMLHDFAPQLRTHILKKGTPYDLTPSKKDLRSGDLFADQLPDVIISNYHKLRGWADHLAEIIRYAVFDEAQELRGGRSQIYRAASHICRRARSVMALTATPIYNYGIEFFNVIDCLEKGALGDEMEFVREWCSKDAGGKHWLKDPVAFGAFLRREGIMLRRTRAEVGRELPPVEKVLHEIDSDAAAIEKMKGDAAVLARMVLSHNEQYRGERFNAAGKFESLMRQATGIAKAPYVIEFVKLILEAGEKVVLYGWHHEVYALWMEGLKAFNPVRYTGEESPTQKDEAREKFIKGWSRVLVMSLRAGAGLDGLQGTCRIVVFGELDWSPGVHEQCIGRVHRDGQEESCSAYFLASDEGSDPIMVDVLGVKREQSEGVRNPDSALAERIDTGENVLRSLARSFLIKHGLELPPEPTPTEIGSE